ncbi:MULTISPECIES: BOW99_gp33 family protein [unclassified Streptococcus]|uniref:BOW99_gp33 family protein n=1 Tax=unclassified Streptococcus TaxID=2608887 RepID=UPI00211AB043|nr:MULTISPECIES: hypothetical protein [unclassified Streptococcus]MCQ9211632.1 hypothetical protein [Streptococcus sp. B01]MCQ9214939.1 hypothetical protein [Streptococcus sp. O1]
MKKEKTQQKPIIRCYLADGTEVDPSDIVIPEGHPVYKTLMLLEKEKLEKTA